mgnify:CR=1 FL=1
MNMAEIYLSLIEERDSMEKEPGLTKLIKYAYETNMELLTATKDLMATDSSQGATPGRGNIHGDADKYRERIS